MLREACGVLVFLTGLASGQQLIAPLPPPPPAFMGMRGFPVSCFDKPTFEEDGLEFFVCNGGGGIAGVRRKDDPAHTVWVRDSDIAQNLNMRVAQAQCGGKRFGVRLEPNGAMSFVCGEEEMRQRERFKAGSKAQWKKYEAYLLK